MTLYRTFFVSFFVMLFSLDSYANNILSFEHKNYKWQESRKLLVLTEQEAKEAAIILKDLRIIEYVFDEKHELKAIETIHKIIRVNTIDAVSMFNKVSIPTDNTIQILSLRARFISATGKITEVNPNNIKEIENINNTAYKIFAIEGAEIGGEIEYYYSLEQRPRLFGREIFEHRIHSKNITLEIITPQNIVFQAKSYNNLPAIRSHTNYANKTTLYVEMVDTYLNNFISPNIANPAESKIGRVDFKLLYYTDQANRKIFTWNSAAQFMAESVYLFQKLPTQQIQTAKNIVQNLLKNTKTTTQKIIAIENFIKENIRMEENCSSDNLKDILEKGQANKLGIVRLFALFFDLAKISNQMVLTSNRNKAKFDKDFENWIFLEHYLFYFPESKAYLAPNNISYRYNLIPPYLTAQDGLFIEYSFQLASTEIKEIVAANANTTLDEEEFVLTFDTENYQMKGTCRRHFSGYYASSLAYAYEMTENKQSLSERIFRTTIADVALADTKIIAYPNNTVTNSTFLDIETSLLSTTLIEKAGDKLLFRIGDLLAQEFKGGEGEIIEQDFNKLFKRKIILTIPDDYIVRNLANIQTVANKNNPVWFEVDYELQKNKIIIQISGSCNQIYYDKKEQIVLQEVIQAMKNFEQTVLVFQKIR
jgi:hypothetical protein